MKKRLIAFIIIALIAISTLVSCSCNYQVFDTNYQFSRAYVKVGEEWLDLEIQAWTDYEGEQIQLTLKDGTILLVSSVNCILYEGELPKSNN